MRKFLIATWVALLSTVTLQAQLKMAVVSDIHVMVPELVEQDGAAFQDYVAHDRKLLMESVALAEAAVDELLAGRPDAVLVTGDLTKDGERVSHEYVAGQLLARLRRAGIPVYVVPGNHDVNNPHARIYRGDEAPRTATVSREEFAALYDDYGYGTALARDTASLSYVVQLNDSVRLLAVDACRYDENDFEANECVVGGRIRPRTLDFIEEQARLAQEAGCRMFVMMHHGLVRHWKWQDLAMGDYLVEHWRRCARLFGRCGLQVVFTGHFHAQDVAAFGQGDRRVYDIETGSTVSYPLPVRFVCLEGDTLAVRSVRLGDTGRLDAGLEPRALAYAEAGIATIVGDIVGDAVPEELVHRAGELVGEAYVAHIAGDERMPEAYAERLKEVCRQVRPYSWKYAFLLEHLARYLSTDAAPQDNEVEILL